MSARWAEPLSNRVGDHGWKWPSRLADSSRQSTSVKRTKKVRTTLTKRSVALQPTERSWTVWDDRLTGFGVRTHPADERAEARRMPTLGNAFEDYMKANPNRSKSTDEIYRYEAKRYLGDWLVRPLDPITRRDVEARFSGITANHGWSPANRAISLLRSFCRPPCVDREGPRNPVYLWLAGGGRFHRRARRRISAPAEVLPCRRAGIEAEVNNPAIRGALRFGLYNGMRREEALTLRWETIDMDAIVFRVGETKTGVPLELPITLQLAEIPERRMVAAGAKFRSTARVTVSSPSPGAN